MESAEWRKLTIPTTLEQVVELEQVLSGFRQQHLWRLVICHGCTYTWLQVRRGVRRALTNPSLIAL